MASPSKNNRKASHAPSLSPLPDPNINSAAMNTTFVQADPSNFRAVVQRLTGADQHPSAHKLPVTSPARRISGLNKQLHERRQSARKPEMIKLNNHAAAAGTSSTRQRSSRLNINGDHHHHYNQMVIVSPVSPLELLSFSPRTPLSASEEEEKAIAEKGFYLHPSPLTTPRGCEPPELLPLFPLHSPSTDSSSSS